MKKAILSVLALVPLLMAQTPAPPAPSPTPDEVCAKVEEKERPDCVEAMKMLSSALPPEQWTVFTGCLAKASPLTKESVAPCVTPDIEAAIQAQMEAEMKKAMEGGSTPPAPAPAPTNP